MALQRMDRVSVVDDDLQAATAFFTGLGMEVEGEQLVEGEWVDRVNGFEGVRVDIVMLPPVAERRSLTTTAAPRRARSRA